MANDVTVVSHGLPLVRQFSKQIAGHAVEKGSSKPGMLKHADGCLLKPILSPPRGPRELQFYQNVFDHGNTDNTDVALQPLLPSFRGTFRNPENKEFLKLEDLTERFNRPCILDVKMGSKTYDFEASEQKIRREQQKYKHTKVIGFCIPGMQVYNIKTQQYLCKDKDYGKKLTSETIKDAFRLYLNSETGMNSAVIKSFLLHLCNVRNWFLTQTKYVFFASSLLLIYDADSLMRPTTASETQESLSLHSKLLSTCHCHYDSVATSTVSDMVLMPVASHTISKLEDRGLDGVKFTELNKSGVENVGKQEVVKGVEEIRPNAKLNNPLRIEDEQGVFNLTDVRMIDFAHVFSSSSHDENYLHGLNNLLIILESLLKEAE